MRSWNLPLGAPPKIYMMGIGVHHPLRDYDRYQIASLWCLHFYRYDGELKINGESFEIAPGSCSVTPPDAVLEYSYYHAPSIHAVAHFALTKSKTENLALPAMRALGDDFDELTASFEAAIPLASTQPARAAARVWDVLWRLGESFESASQSTSTPLASHAAIERARGYIEMRLAQQNLRVEEVARHAGFSHNHFTRTFLAEVGSTPSQYIRARRVERARHLLKHSTLPAKAISSQCGLGDLQAFNKTLRRELGLSTRALRKK